MTLQLIITKVRGTYIALIELNIYRNFEKHPFNSEYDENYSTAPKVSSIFGAILASRNE